MGRLKVIFAALLVAGFLFVEPAAAQTVAPEPDALDAAVAEATAGGG